ncbi:hypothetical protein [Ruminococcus albus]|nr:hypothetical protein [Ruminococcus albus]
MILFKKHRLGVNVMIRTAALTLISVMAVLLTGCSDGKMLSDNELTDVLSEKLGNTVEIIEAPEGKSDGEYSMKCADGTEFTVKRVHLDYDYFGANRYYQYECDYLLKWVSDHPEVNALFDERGISHKDYGNGTGAVADSFEEIQTVVETACELVESSSYRIPAVSDFDGDEYKVKFDRPVIAIECLGGKNEETHWLWQEFEYQDGTEPVDHDEELQVYLAEQQYVDDYRHGDLEVSVPDELLEKYGPSQMKARLKSSEYSMIRADYTKDNINMGKTETLYYVRDGFDNKNGETLDFPYIASFAEFTGFKPVAADDNSYTLAKGEEKVIFRFSESDSYAERNGVRIELRGKLSSPSDSCYMDLTTDDLTKLFDTEFKFDYINGTAEITNTEA